ncbi:hypothetical protein FJT64_012567 [Amphibalanus amphitrite]|uniref:Uncharacterized protein n=1 Tax=Amphibalanus amphitrite TaxID=1232801 RepID=A0A6A4V7H4_AMPAM|nr:hypothetical protein FJT64_012567 [Amphibalanus amphitrite]
MAGAELTSSNLEAHREELAFVAGFVAHKCHHIDATLGSRSPDFSGAAGDTLKHRFKDVGAEKKIDPLP